MTWGIGIFNQGVFPEFFEREYGRSRSTLSIGPMSFRVWAGVVGVAVGRLIERCGPRPILTTGARSLRGGATALGLTRRTGTTTPGPRQPGCQPYHVGRRYPSALPKSR
jgi:hypothetical protein